MRKLSKVLIVLVLMQATSGCAVMALTSAGKIPVEDRQLVCEHGVKKHHEVRDLKRLRHEVDFECFKSETRRESEESDDK